MAESLEEFHNRRPRPTVRIGYVAPYPEGEQAITVVGELDTVGEAGHDSIYDVVILNLIIPGEGTSSCLIPLTGIRSWEVVEEVVHSYTAAPAV